jgi:hypothetical protein
MVEEAPVLGNDAVAPRPASAMPPETGPMRRALRYSYSTVRTAPAPSVRKR